MFAAPDSAPALGLLGAGLMAGNAPAGFQSAIGLLAGSKDRELERQLRAAQLQEAQSKLSDQQRARDFLTNLPSPQFQAGANALAAGGGPTNANAARIPQVSPMQNLLYQGVKAGVTPFDTYASALQPKAPIKVGAGETLLTPDTYKPLFTNPKEQATPAAIQEYQFARQQGYQGSFDQWSKEQKQAGATKLNVGVNTDKSYFSNLAEALAKNDAALVDAARSAPERVQNAQRVKQLLAQNPITGTGAEARLSLNKALTTAGLIDGKNVADTETLASTLASQTLDAIKTSGLGSGQGFTDKDRQFLERARSGNIEMNAITLGRLADLNERSARVSIGRGNAVIKKLRSTPQSGQFGTMLDPIEEPPVLALPSVARQPAAPAGQPGVRFLGFE
jgi:hypothetical protein